MSRLPRSVMVAGPVAAGLCRYCLRQVWRGHTTRTGLLPAADTVAGACSTCAKWCLDHPGEDPRHSIGATAEQVPAERGESTWRWRLDPRRACRSAPPTAFDPDPDPDDPQNTKDYRATLRHARQRAAVEFCAPCPLRYHCRAAAHLHGYEGLYGGVVFGRMLWTDQATGEQGFTRHARPGWRRAYAARTRMAA
jgi:hypothetical protein